MIKSIYDEMMKDDYSLRDLLYIMRDVTQAGIDRIEKEEVVKPPQKVTNFRDKLDKKLEDKEFAVLFENEKLKQKVIELNDECDVLSDRGKTLSKIFVDRQTKQVHEICDLKQKVKESEEEIKWHKQKLSDDLSIVLRREYQKDKQIDELQAKVKKLEEENKELHHEGLETVSAELVRNLQSKYTKLSETCQKLIAIETELPFPNRQPVRRKLLIEIESILENK